MKRVLRTCRRSSSSHPEAGVHLRECEPCRRRADRLRLVLRVLEHGEPSRPTEEELRELRERNLAVVIASARRRRWTWPWSGWLLAGAVAAAVLLAMVVRSPEVESGLPRARVVLAAPARYEVPVRRALIIAHNGAPSRALQPLRYADDDGELWAEVLERLGAEVWLLTHFDADTRRVAQAFSKRARPPTDRELERAVSEIQALGRRDAEAGRQVEVFVVYVGHGALDSQGRPFLALDGGRLDAARLFTRVVDRLGPGSVHLLLDACHGRDLVGGGDGANGSVSRTSPWLEARPGVGVLAAGAQEGETYEWASLRAGIFSHVLRSGLLGGADADGDGTIQYGELGAFAVAALEGSGTDEARPRPLLLPPGGNAQVSLLGPAPGAWIEISPEEALSRLTVEDEQGRRIADLHAAHEGPLRLAVLERGTLRLRTPQWETWLEERQREGELPDWSPPDVQRRGPVGEPLTGRLFAVPFGRAFYQAYLAEFERRRQGAHEPGARGLTEAEVLGICGARVCELEPLCCTSAWTKTCDELLLAEAFASSSHSPNLGQCGVHGRELCPQCACPYYLRTGREQGHDLGTGCLSSRGSVVKLLKAACQQRRCE